MDPDKVKGDIQRPFNPPEEEPSDKIDPEKFKKVMKIDESDETQKRNTRNLPKEEEEGEDENVQETPTPSPASSSFSEFMSDKDELDNVFDKESGGIRRQVAPEEGSSFTAPPQESISTEGVELNQESEQPQTGQDFSAQPQGQGDQTDNSQTGAQQPPAAQPPQQQSSSGSQQEGGTSGGKPQPQESYGNIPFFQGELEETSPQQLSQSQQQQQGSTPSGEQPSETPPSKQVQKPSQEEKGDEQGTSKKKEDDSSLLAFQPKTSDLEALKKKPPQWTTPQEKIIPRDETSQGKEGETAPSKLEEEQPQKLEEGIAPAPKEKKETSPTMEEGLTGTDETKNGPFQAQPKEGDLSGEEKPKTPEEQIQQGVVPKPTDTPLKEASPFQRFTPQEVRNQKVGKEGETATTIEGIPVPASTEGGQGEMGQGKKDDDSSFIEANTDTAGIPLPSFDVPIPATEPSAAAPAYSKLSADVTELFEKMGGVMLIQQDKGITTTTMNINMPGSIFNGVEIILEQYSTAPNSFNIQLKGSPESVKIFSQNLDALKASFNQANFNFQANILNPVLTSARKSPHLIRRKGSGRDSGSSRDKRGA